jgi:Restriction endonuclease
MLTISNRKFLLFVAHKLPESPSSLVRLLGRHISAGLFLSASHFSTTFVKYTIPSIREAFKLRSAAGEGVIEQIDGVIEFQGRVYLVEVKWWNKPLGVNEIAPHMVRIFRRHDANGMIISDSGFTEPAVSECRDILSQKTVVLSSLHEIVNVLYEESDLVDWLRKKINAAIVDRNPFLDTARRSVA